MISTNYIKKGTDQMWVGGVGRRRGEAFSLLSLSLSRVEKLLMSSPFIQNPMAAIPFISSNSFLCCNYIGLE